MSNNIPVFKMHDGYKIPAVGFGTSSVLGKSGAESVENALKNGYRLIDTAIRYENEGAVGEGIRRSSVPREEVFVTSKLRGGLYDYDRALAAIEESLFRTGLEYFDLFLLHWPNPKQDKYTEAWKALIQAQKNGYVRSIGVSNFEPAHINRLIDETSVKPAVNQIELHPYFNQKELREFNKEHDIITESWSPLSRARTVIYDETLKQLAENKNKEIAQVILRWHYQHGVLPIPKASSSEHQQANLNIFDFELTEVEMQEIDSLTQEEGRIDNQNPNEYEEF
ncbi:aldo/keto reductase [Jeotgalicoccus psychrophilus]|uniref:aldo/keto reductase n=1 Tax=Jeotgalicoccus psychrophilus TaxID=157228 RepID=UPI00040D1848|nr:aldo/keto reductase [Jeotgalicoccus psychrophilus]